MFDADFDRLTDAEKARLAHLPPRVPFRNIRQLLSMHATATPDKVFMIAQDAPGEWHETTFAEFNARVHQTAGFLYDDLGVRRGSRVAIMFSGSLDNKALEEAVLVCACWLVGALVVSVFKDSANKILQRLNVEAVFVTLDGLHYGNMKNLWKTLPTVRLVLNETIDAATRDELRANDIFYLPNETAHRPNTFISTDERASLNDNAYIIALSDDAGQQFVFFHTQSALLHAALSFNTAWGLSGNQTLMLYTTTGLGHPVAALLAPLYAGMTIVHAKFGHSLMHLAVQHRVNLIYGPYEVLNPLLNTGHTRDRLGRLIPWGSTLGRHDVRHLRLLAIETELEAEEHKGWYHNFEELYTLPIHGSGALAAGDTCCCIIPPDLSWDERRRWMYESEHPCLGVPVDGLEVVILDPDGRILPAGERGEVCVRGKAVTSGSLTDEAWNAWAFRFGWLHTGDEGYYVLDDRRRPVFFLTEGDKFKFSG